MSQQVTLIILGSITVASCIIIDRVRGGSAICKGIAIPSALGVLIAVWQRTRGVGIDLSWQDFPTMSFTLWMVCALGPPGVLSLLRVKRKDQLKYLVGIWIFMALSFYLTGFRFFS